MASDVYLPMLEATVATDSKSVDMKVLTKAVDVVECKSGGKELSLTLSLYEQKNDNDSINA